MYLNSLTNQQIKMFQNTLWNKLLSFLKQLPFTDQYEHDVKPKTISATCSSLFKE